MASERVQGRIDRLLDQVEEAIEQRDWGHVPEFAQDVIALDRDNSDARAFLEAAEQRLSAPGPACLDEDVQSTSITGSQRPATQVSEPRRGLPHPHHPEAQAIFLIAIKSLD